ncbi:MAG: hypothetical protein NC930_04130 [Candidatus Omnitrophica bacterium]|nr:hypothetical protein [Candidatus Omnitrophota bacterium]
MKKLGFKNRLFAIPLTVGLTFLFLGFVKIKSAEFPDYGEGFGHIVTRASIRLQDEAAKRPFKLKFMNDSLEKTAQAARLMASGGSFPEILALLDEASTDYRENSFAILLQAVLLNAHGDQAKANRLYEEFLKRSRTFSSFDEVFLKWGEFHFLRRIVYEILVSRGVSFQGREKEIQVRIPYEKLILYALKPGTWDFVMNICFIFIIVFGAVGLVLAALRGADFSDLVFGGLLGIYLGVWISYFTWLYDLAFGLMWGWSRFYAVPVFLGSILILYLAAVIKKIWTERLRPLETGYTRCPHCHGVIVQLLIECPLCRQKIDGESL